jgi:hypothetical protein
MAERRSRKRLNDRLPMFRSVVPKISKVLPRRKNPLFFLPFAMFRSFAAAGTINLLRVLQPC